MNTGMLIKAFAVACALALMPNLALAQQAAQTARKPSAPAAAAQATSGESSIRFEEILAAQEPKSNYNFTAIAIGAVAGVVAANAILPALGYSAVIAEPVTAAGLQSAFAASRITAISSAVFGGVAGQIIYTSVTGK